MLSWHELEDGCPQHASACSNTILAFQADLPGDDVLRIREPHPPQKAEIEGSAGSYVKPCSPRTMGEWNHGRGRGRDPYVDVVTPFVIQRVPVGEGIQGSHGEALCNDCCMALQGNRTRSSKDLAANLFVRICQTAVGTPLLALAEHSPPCLPSCEVP